MQFEFVRSIVAESDGLRRQQRTGGSVAMLSSPLTALTFTARSALLLHHLCAAPLEVAAEIESISIEAAWDNLQRARAALGVAVGRELSGAELDDAVATMAWQLGEPPTDPATWVASPVSPVVRARVSAVVAGRAGAALRRPSPMIFAGLLTAVAASLLLAAGPTSHFGSFPVSVLNLAPGIHDPARTAGLPISRPSLSSLPSAPGQAAPESVPNSATWQMHTAPPAVRPPTQPRVVPSPPPPAPLAFVAAPDGPLAGEVGEAFAGVAFRVSGARAPYSWTVTPSIPLKATTTDDGLTLSGTPTSDFSGRVTVTVRAADGSTASRSADLVIAPALTLDAVTLPRGEVGVAFAPTAAVKARGGLAPYRWTTVGTGPLTATPGADSLVLSGTPSSAYMGTVTITLTDRLNVARVVALPLTIAARLSLPTSSTITFKRATPAGATQLSAAGGVPGYTWSATGLPAGLVLASNGVLSGTPTAPAGSYTVKLTVVDALSVSATGDQAIAIT